jgi:hypothetical protein
VQARVSTYECDLDALIEGFEWQAGLVRRLDGSARAYLFVDRGGGRAMVVACGTLKRRSTPGRSARLTSRGGQRSRWGDGRVRRELEVALEFEDGSRG